MTSTRRRTGRISIAHSAGYLHVVATTDHVDLFIYIGRERIPSHSMAFRFVDYPHLRGLWNGRAWNLKFLAAWLETIEY